MRNRTTCVAEGKDFLDELIAYDMSVGQPKSRCRASEQARAWCKARKYVEFVGPHTKGASSYKKGGWVITDLGRRKINECLPL